MTIHDKPMRTSENTSEDLSLEQASVEVPEHEEVHDSDDDSAIETYPSSTESIHSWIVAYRKLNGRDYHSEGWDTSYWLPIDTPQLEAQEYTHTAILRLLEDRLHLADLTVGKKPIRRVLDIGAGKGYWAIDFADTNPHVEVIGTDLSPIGEEWVPSNLRLEIEDCNQEWTFADSDFDFIHLRSLSGSVKNWAHLFGQAYRCTKPGGLIESHEPSFKFRSDYGTIEPESALARLGDIFETAGRKTGCSFTVVDGHIQSQAMREAGFDVVDGGRWKMPIGDWPRDSRLKQAGLFARHALLDDLEGYLFYVMTQVLERPEDEALVLAAQVRKQCKEMYVHVEHRIVVGRKPWSDSG